MTTAMMTALTNWVSPNAMHALGWALLHFLWQGTALAALAAAAMALCRRASVRYALGVGALVLMLLAPMVTFLVFSQRSGVADAAKSSPLAAEAWPIARGRTAASGSTQPSFLPARDTLPWLVEAWLIGVAFFSLRSLGGFFLLERERRRKAFVVNPRVLEICHALQRRLGLDRAIAYCECKWLQAPAVSGWFRPVVFLPVAALAGLSEEQLESVIAHELAHVQRLDLFVNVFQICVETLLFYHPAVWWLNQRIRAEREHCCDEMAVALCGNAVEYARALTLMEEWRSAPVLAMAANRGPLSERILHLLGLNSGRSAMRNVGFAGSLLFLGAALVAGNALFGIAYPKPTAHASTSPLRRLLQSAAAQAQPARPASVPAPAAKPSPAQPAQRAEQAETAQSYIDALKSAGLTNLTADELIALKVQDVSPGYVRDMHELGLHPDADGFVSLKVQGVTPEYIKELRSLGFSPDADQIIALKVQGVDAGYVQGMKEVGIQCDADQIVALKVQGVTPDYVRELRANGLQVDSDDVVALKVQGVTPAYMQGLRAQGLNPSADDVVGMKVQGITPEYIRDIRALGLNPSADDLVGMKVQGVTPEYIRDMHGAGLKPSVEQVVALKVQGVTPEYVRALHASGLRDFQDDADCYVAAKVQGITPEFITQAQKHGFKDLDLDKLIQIKRLGVLDTKGEI